MRVSVKLILPKKQFASIAVEKKMIQSLISDTERDLVKAFEGTVQGWQSKPEFHSEKISNSRSVGLRVFAFGRGLKQYNIVNFGSPPHPITARRPSGSLKFRHGNGYISATKPGSLVSSSKSSSGAWVQTYSVEHPGFPAREFDKQIAEKYEDAFKKDMQAAIDRAVKEFQQ